VARFVAAGAVGLSMLFSAGQAGAQTSIRIGYVTPADGAHASAAVPFAEALEQIAPGRFTVEQFPGGSLGNERELAEALQLGSLEMAVIGTSVLGNFVPEFQITEMPFLFRTPEHARGVLDGEIGQELLDSLSNVGIKGLGMGEIGFRHTTNSRGPIRTIEDLAGLKIRVVENPVSLSTWRSLGALPTPMAFPEVYSALQQRVIDAQENPMSIIIPQRFWEPNTYMSLTAHGFTPIILLFSQAVFDGLAPEDQEAVLKAARAGVLANRAFVDKVEEEGLTDLESKGVEIVREIDRSKFEERIQPVYAEYEDVLGDLIRRIQAAQ
jgi:tripartite ATP-independent transporter DctP family solute receptor